MQSNNLVLGAAFFSTKRQCEEFMTELKNKGWQQKFILGGVSERIANLTSKTAVPLPRGAFLVETNMLETQIEDFKVAANNHHGRYIPPDVLTLLRS